MTHSVKLRFSRNVVIGDRHVMIALVACLALAALWQWLAYDLPELLAAGQAYGSPLGAGVLLTLLALFSVVNRMGDDALLSRADLAAISVAGAFFALPSVRAACLGMTIVAAILIPRRDPRLASIGQLLLSLASFMFLGRAFFFLVSPYVISMETTIVASGLSLFGGFSRENMDIIAPNGHTIFIEPQCSAFHNTTLAALIWLAFIKMERLYFLRSDFWALAAMIGTTIALNTIRIGLMAQSRPMLEYWHDGPGVTIASVAMLAAMLAISFLSRAEPAVGRS